MAYLPSARRAWQRHATASLVLRLGLAIGAAAGVLLAAVLALAPWVLVRDEAVQVIERQQQVTSMWAAWMPTHLSVSCAR